MRPVADCCEDDLTVRVDRSAGAGVHREAVLARVGGYEGAGAAVDQLRDRDARELDDLVRGNGHVLLPGLRDAVARTEAAVLRGAAAVAGLVRELELIVHDRFAGGRGVDVERDHPLAVRGPEGIGSRTAGHAHAGRGAGNVGGRPEQREVVVEEETAAVVAGEANLQRSGRSVGGGKREVEVDRLAFLVLGDVPRGVSPVASLPLVLLRGQNGRRSDVPDAALAGWLRQRRAGGDAQQRDQGND